MHFPAIEIGVGLFMAAAMLIWPELPPTIAYIGLGVGMALILWGFFGRALVRRLRRSRPALALDGKVLVEAPSIARMIPPEPPFEARELHEFGERKPLSVAHITRASSIALEKWRRIAGAYTRCEVISYATEPLVNLQIELTFDVLELRKREDGYSTGDSVDTFTYTLVVPRLDPGPDHRHVVWLVNSSASFAVRCVFPKSVDLTLPSGEKLAGVKLIPSQRGGVIVSPWPQDEER